MTNTEFIQDMKQEIIKLDSMDYELELLQSMCTAFEEAFSAGCMDIKEFAPGFTLFWRLLREYTGEHTAFTKYLTETYLDYNPAES